MLLKIKLTDQITAKIVINWDTTKSIKYKNK